MTTSISRFLTAIGEAIAVLKVENFSSGDFTPSDIYDIIMIFIIHTIIVIFIRFHESIMIPMMVYDLILIPEI